MKMKNVQESGYSSAVELDSSSLLVARDQDDRRSIGDMSEDEVFEYFEDGT